MKKYNVAVVGATGLVGRTFLKVLEEYNFPINNLILYASARSKGKVVTYCGKEYVIEELTKEATQLSLSTAEEDVSKMQNLSEISRDLRNNLDSKLEQIAEKYSSSYPYFDTEKLAG